MLQVRLGGRATSAVLVRPELLAYCCNDSVIRYSVRVVCCEGVRVVCCEGVRVV